MSANPWAGEVGLTLDGRAHVLKLTLGALAGLEARLGAETLPALVERFEQGRFAARDVLELVAAGLRGGGWRGEMADLLEADIKGGPVEAARVAARLLSLAFAPPPPERP
ncbi:gene transfer agent family protein [Brevirhabdus sp.]|uniref:gene transfer agent family protein n=1 Tax=Brevirhabdus sp. TaxID=2004514 RepID=UPI004059EB48